MTRISCFLAALLLFGVASARAQEPSVQQIEAAINDGVGNDFGPCYQVAEVQVVRGGVTSRADCLYLCDATLVWAISYADLIKFWEDPELMRTPEFASLVEAIGQERLKALLSTPVRFKAGDEVSQVRLRVRIEQAGGDWIVTEIASRTLEAPLAPEEQSEVPN